MGWISFEKKRMIASFAGQLSQSLLTKSLDVCLSKEEERIFSEFTLSFSEFESLFSTSLGDKTKFYNSICT